MKITPIDESKTIDGTWTDYMGVPLKIARANNERFKKVFRKLSKPYHREIEKDRLPEETAQMILCKSLAEGILVDWDPEKFPEKLEYSVENATQLLSDDPDCRDFVVAFSREQENFYIEEQEEQLGNS